MSNISPFPQYMNDGNCTGNHRDCSKWLLQQGGSRFGRPKRREEYVSTTSGEDRALKVIFKDATLAFNILQ